MKRAISSGVQPPSGPMAREWLCSAEWAAFIAACESAWLRVRVCSVSLSRMRVVERSVASAGLSRVGDRWHGGAAGLLAGLVSDATPAFDPFDGGLGEVLFGAAGKDGRDGGDAEFGGFFDGPFKVVEFEDSEIKVERQGVVGFELFVEKEVDPFR